MPQRIDTLLDSPAGVVVVLGALVGRVDIVGELAGQVALVAVDASIRAFAFNQLATNGILTMGSAALPMSLYGAGVIGEYIK
ncbi:hypothetical protein [Pseudomonas fluorescens]